MDYVENDDFLRRTDSSLRRLFEKAKGVDELNFAFSLCPEFRPYKINTAIEAQEAFEQYTDFLNTYEERPIKARIALAFYCHISEASGFWEIPKNLLGIVDGGRYNVIPFLDIVRKYGSKGGAIPPNVNKIMLSLSNYSRELGFNDLAEIFLDAFDPDLRNGFAHADYALLREGVCVKSRYDSERIITWKEFNILLHKALNFYETLRTICHEYQLAYTTPKIVTGRINDRDPEGTWKIHYILEKGLFSIEGGPGYQPKRA